MMALPLGVVEQKQRVLSYKVSFLSMCKIKAGGNACATMPAMAMEHTAEMAGTASQAAEHSDSGIHIALAAEQVGEFMGIPITNTLVTSWVVMAILITIAIIVGSRVRLVPGKVQAIFELGYEFVFKFIKDTLEDEKLAKKFFPFLITLFLFIFTANIIEFTPGIGSIGFFHGGEFTPLLRSVNTDLNVTLALTIISVFVIEFMGIFTLGFVKYGGKFISFKSPLAFVVGLIELMSELVRFVSFSFRLFGNIFAGEVMIAVVSFFVPYILPVPIMAFEMFIGVVQAAIFMMLTLFFIKLAITAHDKH